MNHLTPLSALPSPWMREGSWSGLSAAGRCHGLLFLITRGRCGRTVGGQQGVATPFTPIIGGGIIFTRSNLDNRLIGIQGVGCGGLCSRAKVHSWLRDIVMLPGILAMHSLERALPSWKHILGEVYAFLLFLLVLTAILLARTSWKKGRDHTSESTPSCAKSQGVVRTCVAGSYVHKGASIVSHASIDRRRRVLIKRLEAPKVGSS